jgi:hypothetical protein
LEVQQPIQIIVKNGTVTLERVVDNEGDKNVANIRNNASPENDSKLACWSFQPNRPMPVCPGAIRQSGLA